MSATAPSIPATSDHAHFLFSEEHELFRRTVGRFVTEELNPNTAEWEAAGIPPRSIFEKAGELGCFGICVPTEYGGMASDASMTVVWGASSIKPGGKTTKKLVAMRPQSTLRTLVTMLSIETP